MRRILPGDERIGIYSFPELDVYTRLGERELLKYYEPHGGLFIAESPKVISRALDAGYRPVSMLVDRKQMHGETMELIRRVCGNDPAASCCGKVTGVVDAAASCRGNETGMADAAVPCPETVKNADLSAAAVSLLPGSAAAVPVFTADESELRSLTGFPLTRGVLCAMKRKPLPSLRGLCSHFHRIAVLENVMNPTNVGAIFRSAAAMGMEAVLLTEGSADPLYRRAIRVSMGTVFQIPWTIIRGRNEAGEIPQESGENVFSDRCRCAGESASGSEETGWIKELKSLGYTTCAMALLPDSIEIDDPRLKNIERLAVVLGTEGDGLAASTVADCDYRVIIPMSRGVDSLNVAAASAVAFWELGKKLMSTASARK